MKNNLLSLILLAFGSLLTAQNATSDPLSKVVDFHKKRQHALLTEYAAFLSIPNTMNDTASLRANANFIVDMMKKRGISNAKLIYGTSPNAIPAVFGDIKVPNATTTIVFYTQLSLGVGIVRLAFADSCRFANGEK